MTVFVYIFPLPFSGLLDPLGSVQCTFVQLPNGRSGKSMQIKTATLPCQKTLGYYINNLTSREKHFPCRHPRRFLNRPTEVPEHSYHGGIVGLSLGVRDFFTTILLE